jgi:hypothetical protein
MNSWQKPEDPNLYEAPKTGWEKFKHFFGWRKKKADTRPVGGLADAFKFDTKPIVVDESRYKDRFKM